MKHVAAAIERMTKSTVLYGTFDLVNDDDLLALFYEVRKQVVKPADSNKDPVADPETEVVASERAAFDSSTRFKPSSQLKTPNPGATFELALLGTGASIAYYLTSHKHEIDREQTVVIGKPQPWGVSAARGSSTTQRT